MNQRPTGHGPGYAEPFGWWGFGSQAERRSIVQLIGDDLLTARVAAFLWLAMEERASVVVAALPHGAGKTTLLTALLDFLPDSVAPTYLRGWYERFEFLDQTSPDDAYLLCNEISQHLPTYLWGRGVRRVFEAMASGYGMATTVHACGAAQVLELLTAYPLEVELEQAARIDFVLTLGNGMWRGAPLRRLMLVEQLTPVADGVAIDVLARRDVLLGSLESRPGRLVGALAERFGLDPDWTTFELARRERCLERLVRDGVVRPEEAGQAIRAYRSQE